ncbi:hypothetical protein K6119_19195 [Paracrocinitomix mangrovi]|uniref:hypothetical protein n=1 Tax=Paracrocinitomix mangrovi TaxID=2862509 RepID=UPI001C8E55CA|nr:hypothetical protein [Paracrocinitomix mangrovi]UKN01852.1 hypothetical protein K6119_19195 [Paracrocinitomix mangrovi]
MKVLFLSLSFLFSLFTVAQLDKKLKKVIGLKDLVELEATDNYKWTPEGNVIFYPSNTLKDDTTGASNEGEFLMFQDDIVNQKGELFKIFRLSWVSNMEYNYFMKWIQDSLTLESVYANDDPTGNNAIDEELIGEMLIHPNVYYDSVNLYWNEFDPSQPFINRGLFDLKWEMKGIRDEQIIPLINDLYVYPHERFYSAKVFDERKFWYSYSKNLLDAIYAAPYRNIWASNSSYPFDFYYNLGNHYSNAESCKYYPVIGLTGRQIKAFLHYKEKYLQKELNEKGYNYRVHLSLPTEEEIKLADTSDCDCKMTYLIDSVDMTKHWQITNEDYWEFLIWVQDSVIMERIYFGKNPATGKYLFDHEDVLDMLDYEDVYYDEANLSWREMDPSDRFRNREKFFFNYNGSWKKRIEPQQYASLIQDLYNNQNEVLNDKGNINYRDFKIEHYFYKYYWQDLGRKSQLGELVWDDKTKLYDVANPWYGKDLNFDSNEKIQRANSGMRAHSDLSDFIIVESINLYPGAECEICNKNWAYKNDAFNLADYEYIEFCPTCSSGYKENIKAYDFWTNPEALVKDINYAQALAYYNWKYHNGKAEMDDPLYDDLVPSKEEFDKIQKGEKVYTKSQKLDFPDPWFRYVIHFYPK